MRWLRVPDTYPNAVQIDGKHYILQFSDRAVSLRAVGCGAKPRDIWTDVELDSNDKAFPT